MQHPLMCWDLYLGIAERKTDFRDDLAKLRSITVEGNWAEFPVALHDKLLWENKVVLITSPTLEIIHATKNMFDMNGYRLAEVVGNRPTMFQGEKTEKHQKLMIREALKNKLPFETVITNYKKHGSMYKCHILGYPIYDINGEIVNYVALENAA